MSNRRLKFNKQFFRDFWELLKPYWSSEEKWSALALLGASLLCIIISVRATVALNSFYKDFYNALQNFDKAALMTALLHFGVIVTVLVLAFGYTFYFNALLGARWRRWLTKNYLKKWLHNHTHYRMQLLNNVDNPDQRISEDLEQFPDATLSVFSTIFQSSLTLITFGYMLWGLSGNLSIPIGSYTLVIPGYFLWGALLYAILGTWVVGWIGKKLAGLDYQSQYFNADFRFSLVRLREASEQIALYRGEPTEINKFDTLFSRIFKNYLTRISLRKRLMFFTNGYDTTASLLGIFIALPLYLQKKIQMGGMMQISSAFGQVISASAVLINGFTLFAEWRAVIHRLTEFNKSMEASSQELPFGIKINEHDQDNIIIRDLKLLLPDGKILLDKVNVVLRAGKSFLLSGPSGLGKSTFLRAVAGIWMYGEGQIHLPKNTKTFFLPQKPYLPLGSLKDVLLYPYEYPVDDAILNEALELCTLTKLQHRLNEIRNWAQELSPGEQQLIAFARIFLHKPDIIFLDEATSALDERTESHVYGNLRRFLPHATLVSIGHRRSLHQFHEEFITLSKQDDLAVISTAEFATV